MSKKSQIGQRIREARKAAGLSQESLALETGLSQALISKFELGKNEPCAVALKRIARALSKHRPIDICKGFQVSL